MILYIKDLYQNFALQPFLIEPPHCASELQLPL